MMVMSPSTASNLNPLDIAHRIIELDAIVKRECDAHHFERAAAARDDRVVLEEQLKSVGSDTLIQNVRTALRGNLYETTVIQILEADDITVDLRVLSVLAAAPLPVRWVIRGLRAPCVATLRQRLNVESLESPYYRAHFPIFGSSALSRATYPGEWLQAVAKESAKSSTSVVWFITDLRWLDKIGILNEIVGHLRQPSSEFVACVDSKDLALSERLTELPGVSALAT